MRSAATRAALAVAALVPLFAVACAVGLSLGGTDVSLAAALRGEEPAATVLFKLRLPRVALAAVVGAALSVSGAALQALLRNPLADPFVFGLSGGAALGTAAAAIAGGAALGEAASLIGLLPGQLMACAGAMAAGAGVFFLGRAHGQLVPERALLVGVVFNSFASAAVIGIQAVLAPERTQAVLLWLSGSLGYEPPSVLLAAAATVAVSCAALTALAGRFNLLALGDDGAASLGVDVARTRALVFTLASAKASVAVGAAVALTGLVGFVGLVVPHAVRLLAGPDHRVVLPASALGGAAFLVLADAAARLLFRGLGTEPPVGAVTALVGAPLFVALLRSRR